MQTKYCKNSKASLSLFTEILTRWKSNNNNFPFLNGIVDFHHVLIGFNIRIKWYSKRRQKLFLENINVRGDLKD